MPPSPSTTLSDLAGHAPFFWISMQSHCSSKTDKFSTNCPDFLAVILGYGEVVRAYKEQLDKLQ